MLLKAEDAAGRLIASLEEALEVFDIQHQETEVTKRWSDGLTERFQRLIRDRQEGKPPDPSLQEELLAHQRARAEEWSTGKANERFQASSHLSLRWETAFCDMFDELMQLHAYPERRDDAARIAAQIREIRLLQVDNADEFPSLAPATPETTDESASAVGQPKTGVPASLLSGGGFDKFKHAQSFMAQMDDHRQKVQKVYSEKLTRTRSGLVTALAAAQELATAIRSR